MSPVLLDTNIILDIALDRGEFSVKAGRLIKALSDKNITMFITASSVTDIYYITSKSKGHQNSIDFLKGLINFIDVAGVNKEIILKALESQIKDFEDSVQVEAARLLEIKTVITRNKPDFKNAEIEAYTPDEYIDNIIS